MSVGGPLFHVEPGLLDSAASGMTDLLRGQDSSELRRLPTAPDHYGTSEVHSALVAFCDGWSVGVDALCDRSRWMADSLADAAQAYRDADRTAGVSLVSDPALDAVTDGPSVVP